MQLAGQHVTVMGLGRFGGGVGVSRFLAERGALVRVTDQLDEDQLRDSVAQLADLRDQGRVSFRLGGHDTADFTGVDLVVANPAVKPGNAYLRAARDAGVPVTSEIRLLVSHLPDRGKTIGVTGTAGKSTTVAMIGHLLTSLGRRVHVGGNLGGSLLTHLPHIHPEGWVVLELSSFMLAGLREDGWSPHIALLTNLSPNHLDWHGSEDAYRAAKQTIFDFQDAHDIAIREPAPPENDAGYPLALPGEHNRANAGFAFAAVRAAGFDPSQDALADFAGLPHRLQLVIEYAGVRFINDSKCTTPEAARLALQSFPMGRVHLIAGGYDKGSDLTAMATQAAERCRGIYTIGATGETIAGAAKGSAQVTRCGDLETAVRAAVAAARAGEVVLLSPGCASWDQFENFEARGRAFTEAVLRHTTETGAGGL